MVALDGNALGDLRNRNLGGARENFLQSAVVAGIKVLEKNESHAGGIRQIGEQSGESFEAAR
jgi:hypothetical protein